MQVCVGLIFEHMQVCEGLTFRLLSKDGLIHFYRFVKINRLDDLMRHNRFTFFTAAMYATYDSIFNPLFTFIFKMQTN